jgi:hypothetical protein
VPRNGLEEDSSKPDWRKTIFIQIKVHEGALSNIDFDHLYIYISYLCNLMLILLFIEIEQCLLIIIEKGQDETVAFRSVLLGHVTLLKHIN